MPSIDCFFVPVPRENKAAHEELARIAAAVLKDYGALRDVKCCLNASGPDASRRTTPVKRGWIPRTTEASCAQQVAGRARQRNPGCTCAEGYCRPTHAI